MCICVDSRETKLPRYTCDSNCLPIHIVIVWSKTVEEWISDLVTVKTGKNFIKSINNAFIDVAYLFLKEITFSCFSAIITLS